MRLIFSILIIGFISFASITESTSNYEGVSWDEKRKLWQIQFHFNDEIRISHFKNKLDAAKRLNQLCESKRISSKNAEISNQQTKQQTSKYKGVYLHQKSGLWRAQLSLKGQMQKYGGCFKDELDAAKRVNQLCVEMEIPPQNPGISAIPNKIYQPPTKQQTSKYKGVYLHQKSGQWRAQLRLKGQMQTYGGCFKDELDAAKRINQLCVEMEITPQNPGISAIPNKIYQPPTNQQTSKYKGVYLHKQSGQWRAQLCLKGQMQKYGGCFEDELDAAKRINQLCVEMEIPPQNPGISAIPNKIYQPPTKEKTSQYIGVSWDKQMSEWRAQLTLKGKINKYGGCCKDELECAKKVNQLCAEMNIPPRNPGISAMPKTQYQIGKIQPITGNTNPENRYKIPQTTHNSTNEKKRKRKEDIIFKEYYFYEEFLK